MTTRASSLRPSVLTVASLLVAGSGCSCGDFMVVLACREDSVANCKRFDPHRYVLEDEAGRRQVLTSSGATSLLRGGAYVLSVERIQPLEALAALPIDPEASASITPSDVHTLSGFELSTLRVGAIDVEAGLLGASSTKLFELAVRAEDLVAGAEPGALEVAATFSANAKVRRDDGDEFADVEAELVRTFPLEVEAPPAQADDGQVVFALDAWTPEYGISGAGSFGCKFLATQVAPEALLQTYDVHTRCPSLVFTCVSARRSARSAATAATGGDVAVELVQVEEAQELSCDGPDKTACLYCLDSPRSRMDAVTARLRVGERVESVGPVTIRRR
jgi:hypothetical protein